MTTSIQENSTSTVLYDFASSQIVAWDNSTHSGIDGVASPSQNNLSLHNQFDLNPWLNQIAGSINISNALPELNIFQRSGNEYLNQAFGSDVNSSEMALESPYSSVDSLTGLTVDDSLTGSNSSVLHYQGSLRADQFRYSGASAVSIYSGSGNVDFGTGYLDILDLSNLSVNSVMTWDAASATGGGVLAEVSNGVRVFDAMQLSNGHVLLMEGLDGILFQEGFANLNQGVLPNDPLFSQQWNLHMMGVHNAWRFTQGSSSVLMGVQDTGLALNGWGYSHQDIDLSRTYGMSGNLADDFSDASSSHGTPVQGIMAASSNNGIGLSGINWYSDVVNLDVLGGDFSDYELDEATQLMTDYARSTGRRVVINMSLGAHGQMEGAMPGLEQLIALNQDNALFVVSSGNADDTMLSYPAILANSYTNVIAVGASWGTRDWYGNSTTPGERISYAGWWGSNYGQGLSLMGPSEVITTEATTGWGGVNFDYHGNTPAGWGNTPFNGTSAAAPNVAGVASLVWSANPYLRATEVHAIMANTAVDLGAWGYDMAYGHGFVNADAAVRQALALYRMAGGMALTPDSLSPNWEAALTTSQTALNQLQPLSALRADPLAAPPMFTAGSALTLGDRPRSASQPVSPTESLTLELTPSVLMSYPELTSPELAMAESQLDPFTLMAQIKSLVALA